MCATYRASYVKGHINLSLKYPERSGALGAAKAGRSEDIFEFCILFLHRNNEELLLIKGES